MSSRNLVKDADKIKDRILGKRYELSLVYCGNALSRRLNRIYRGRDLPTNVLAFPLSEKSGEIFINTAGLKGFTPLYLFIHACLHLKGFKHGAKMESEEQRLYKLYNGSPHRSRHRHRDALSQDGHSRRGARRAKSRS